MRTKTEYYYYQQGQMPWDDAEDWDWVSQQEYEQWSAEFDFEVEKQIELQQFA
jgi:hypothetical protein